MYSPVKYLNGLGLVASGPRNIKSGAQYDKFFAPPKHEDKYLSYAGTTNDTIGFMGDIIKSTLDDTKQIAQVLRGNNLRSTLSNIFNFVFNHIQYKPDDPTTEELRRPVRAWADRATGVDCDCYAIFIGSILSNLKVPFALRMVKINGRHYYQHVYVVVPKNGKESALGTSQSYYTVDPVLDTFNEEHPFTEKYDLFMQPIKYLNGVRSAALNGLLGATIKQNNLYYSPEAAAETRTDNIIFFDGFDYYDRVEGLHGLGGLNGLGFLKKIWGAVKTAGKFVKKISKKVIKKVTTKKDGSQTGVAKLFAGDPAKKAERQENREERKEARQLKKLNRQSTRLTPVGKNAVPIGTQVPANSSNNGGVSAKDMIDIATSMDKSMGVDSILNLVQSMAPDNKIVNELIDAKAKANAGISSFEARQLAKDAANTAILENQVKTQQLTSAMQPAQQAGFGLGNMNTTQLLLAAGIVMAGISMVRSNNNQTKAA